jgi:hypothetical protein
MFYTSIYRNTLSAETNTWDDSTFLLSLGLHGIYPKELLQYKYFNTISSHLCFKINANLLCITLYINYLPTRDKVNGKYGETLTNKVSNR